MVHVLFAWTMYISTQTAPQAAGRLRSLAERAGLNTRTSPRALRRTFCGAGLVSGVPLRDMHCAMRHAGSRTTPRYDMA